jgi:hypothetical protein
MIAIDSSAFISYFNGEKNQINDLVETALKYNSVVLPPIVLVELLSDPHINKTITDNLTKLPMLEPTAGYWLRASNNRSILLRKKLKARLADTLIAQICLDYNVPLLTCDKDFNNFAKYCNLMLYR